MQDYCVMEIVGASQTQCLKLIILFHHFHYKYLTSISMPFHGDHERSIPNRSENSGLNGSNSELNEPKPKEQSDSV